MMKLQRVYATVTERLYITPMTGVVWFGLGIVLMLTGSGMLLESGVIWELNCHRSETQVDCQPISSVILNQPLALGGSVVLSIGFITGVVSTLIPQRSLRLNRTTQQLTITRWFSLLPISRSYPSNIVQALSKVQELRKDGTTCFKAVLPIGNSSLTLTEGSRYAVADLIAEMQHFYGFPVRMDDIGQKPYSGLAAQTNPEGVSQAEFRSDSQELAAPRDAEARALYKKLKLKHTPMALALSPDGRYLAAGFGGVEGGVEEGRLRVWQVSN
jgi:hypothetical protein